MAHSNISKKSPTQGSPAIDGYAIVGRVGSGSYSTVYKGFKTVNYSIFMFLYRFSLDLNNIWLIWFQFFASLHRVFYQLLYIFWLGHAVLAFNL